MVEGATVGTLGAEGTTEATSLVFSAGTFSTSLSGLLGLKKVEENLPSLVGAGAAAGLAAGLTPNLAGWKLGAGAWNRWGCWKRAG